MKKRGFTLIELLVVISIISVLTSIILISMNTARSKANDAKRVSDMQQIKNAVELYFDTNGYYPLCGVSVSCSSVGFPYVHISTLNVVSAGFISKINNDPINIAGKYGYYYVRGYKKTSSSTYIYTNSTTDYIIATRLENSNSSYFYGWDNNYLNYLNGN